MSILASLITFFVLPLLNLVLIASPHNPTVRQVYGILSSVVEPIVAPFRRIIPPLGNFDMGFFFAAMLLYWISRYLIPGIILPALN